MKRFFTLLPLFAAAFIKPSLVHAQVANVNDSLALVALYDSTDGPHWTNNSGWLNGPVSNWYGVSLDINARVYIITLNGNNLTGTIPELLDSISNLYWLILDDNNLTGNIPGTLGNLSKLTLLSIANNPQLTGGIPSTFGNLSSLNTLDLSGDQLTGSIPSSLSNLSNLVNLLLNNNKLSGGIPPTFAKLAQMTSLELDNNQLTGNIPSLPDSLPKPGWIFVDLGNNHLTGNIPYSLHNLPKLRGLDVHSNLLSGTIPAYLDSLPTLQILNLSNNYFTFDGMEPLVETYNNDSVLTYAPQYSIKLNYSNNQLSVSAGGTLANNTYTWYNGDTLEATITADSVYKPSSAGNYSVAVTNAVTTKLTLYSDTFTITPSDLPITLLNFTAQPAHGGNLLLWQTANELNSLYFDVQRSTDGLHFSNIGKVAAAGKSNTVQSYQFTDALAGLNPSPSVLYYRLEEVDENGAATYSNIIPLKVGENSAALLQLYPNPVRDLLTVQLKGITGLVDVQITDAAGKTLLVKQVAAINGQTITFNTQPLAAGVYFVQAWHNKQGIKQKFVKE